jgi:hypothetical protein
MQRHMLHIFRNTPLGRETLLQSIFFCRTMNLNLDVYLPASSRLWLHFNDRNIPVDLDRSYATSPDTAGEHARDILQQEGLLQGASAVVPGSERKPQIDGTFGFMCCPRSMRKQPSTIGLGHIGTRVRRIVQRAPCAVLLASAAYKPWDSLMVFYGGSQIGARALRLGAMLKERSGLPLSVFTQQEIGPRKHRETITLPRELAAGIDEWRRFDSGDFVENLYHVPHTALVLLGAACGGAIRNYSSKLEKIQATLTNNLLLVGPCCNTPDRPASCYRR